MHASDTLSQAGATSPSQPISPLRALLLVLGLVAPLLVFSGTVTSLVSIWNSSETFSHQYMILPISLWLVWRERARLRQLRIAPYAPALLPLLLCGLAWLLGSLADVQVVRQYAFVGLEISCAVALLGLPVARVIAFPLGFLLLAVPFGEVFIEPLIGVTADFTVAALQMTGIPVLREGNTFTIPSGRWSVVEACSGVRYLIASVTLGLLYAHLNYRAWKRRAAFLAVSIVVPILANGARAYMIVMIGHLSGMHLAVGVDHLIYGWLFFGLVTFILFRIGTRWAEDMTPATAPIAADPNPPGTPAQWLRMLVLVLACTALWPGYAWLMQHRDTGAAIKLDAVPGNWLGTTAFSAWQPAFTPAPAQASYYFVQGQQQAGLTLRYYRGQHPGSTLVSSANRLLGEKDNTWIRLSSDVRQEVLGPQALTVREEIIQGAGPSLVIWRWYWIDRRFVENDYLAKLYQARARLTMQGDDGAALFAFAPYGDKPETARAALRAYLSQNLPAIQAMLDDNAERERHGR